MYCAQCGKILDEGATFCLGCGVSIDTIASDYMMEPPKTGDAKAVTSLVCGIVSWFTCGGFLILPTIGLILGFLGLKSRNKKGIATAGICINAATFLLFPVIIALTIPAVQAAREAARRMQCSSHVKQIVLAFHNYHDSHGTLPPLYTVDEEGNPLHSWRVLILPFIEQGHLYEQIRLDEPWDSPHNRQFHSSMPPIYRCPSDPRRDCAYSAIAGGSFSPATEAESILGLKFSEISDGLSNTLAIVEVKESFNWMDPTADVSDIEFVLGTKTGSYHSGGMNTGLLDGAVRFMPSETDSEILKALATPSGSESLDW